MVTAPDMVAWAQLYTFTILPPRNLDVISPVNVQVPIMLRSKYCQLEDQTEHDLTTLGECPLDQVKPLHRQVSSDITLCQVNTWVTVVMHAIIAVKPSPPPQPSRI